MKSDLSLALMLVFVFPLQAAAGGEFSFLTMPPMPDTVTVPRGDDTFSDEISTQGDFRFGNGSVQSVYVSTNGYISMGITPTANAQNVEGIHSIVSPYGADIDTSVGGAVAYTNFRTPGDDLEEVSSFIEDQLDVEFRGNRMMAARWDNVAQYDGSNTVTSTFQAVLITDGFSSYAVFIYQCGGMGWGGAEIGWQASKADSDKHELSGEDSADIGCRYSDESSAVVFRLERCNDDEFRCDGGRCLNDNKVCDRRSDCDDGADEDGCLDITLIASGAAFGFLVLLLILVSVCIFLYCLSRKRKRSLSITRRTNEATLDLETTPTTSDGTPQGQASVDQVSGATSTQETVLTDFTLYPALPADKEAEFDEKKPPPYESFAPAQPQNVYQGYPAPTYPVAVHTPAVPSLASHQQPQPSAPPPTIEPL